ncbi:MAG: hypothetical protein A2583_16045 [Bdellovibrionales bacterium RIFOXYD1_FULL_53_11]|nr:MAG: hypothetical protein A2583_16045 [Bdellovibrionales bacterium RIFOXYD1_FULL_53_11]
MRYLYENIKKDIAKKMVFISGPRQVGKTFLSKELLRQFDSDQYFNWDRTEHRTIILKSGWNRNKQLVVLDEIHKYKNWKSWLKGIYDTEKRPPNFVVTGSAMLDVFRRGGDSLLGRHYTYRLHPFSLNELVKFKHMTPGEALDMLFARGGFPEPLFGDTVDADRWRKERLSLVLRNDMLSLENVRNLGDVELLVDLLRERVGSTFTYQSLARILSVSPQTVKSWIELLERMYVVFTVAPFHRSLKKAIKKERKIFFWDYSDVINEGARFENLVASHLLKYVHFMEDTKGQNIKLWTLRDKLKREVDFCITVNNKPVHLIEVKLSDTAVSGGIEYYGRIWPEARATWVVKQQIVSGQYGKVVLCGAGEFLGELV